jgi:hypothetical protein
MLKFGDIDYLVKEIEAIELWDSGIYFINIFDKPK